MKAFITGGSRGIGKEITKYFEDKGIEVIKPTRGEIDLSNPDKIQNYLSTLSDDIGIVINNAGINNLSNIEDTTYQDLQNTFNVNYFSPFLICSYFLKRFKKNNYGRIINISSIWGKIPKNKRSTYASSKSSLHTLTKQIVSETKGYNILTNTVSPGYISTDLTYQNNNPEDIKIIKNSIPLKKLGTPQEIAKWVYYLTSKNDYINGQEIIIDGGFSCTI
jgi:3-oxoacyl-[acyl-carrier protein] reductase